MNITNKNPLGKLSKIDPREYWSNEATKFTPWLTNDENISLLGETLGLEFQLEATEKEVGPFRADILCKEVSSDHWVLIENQLERTNHTHLGQIITYASGLKASTIIWIAKRFTDEHRAAIDWLNEISSQPFNFFAIEIELWQIGNSPFAPKFNIVAQPNNWKKIVKNSTGGNNELTDLQKLQFEFWSQYKEYMEENSNVLCSNPRPAHSLSHPIGRKYFEMYSIASTYNNASNSWTGELRVEFNCNDRNSRKITKILQNQQTEIEKELGESITFDIADNRQRTKIYINTSMNIQEREKWPEQRQWFREKAEKIYSVFHPRTSIKTIDKALQDMDEKENDE